MLGEYQGGGRTEPTYLIRRGDGRMLEVSSLLYLVATNLDGARTLEDIASRVGAGLGRSVSSGSIRYLIEEKLRPLGILATEAAAAPKAAPLLALTVRAGVVPPVLVRRMTGILRPLFFPPVVVALLVGVVFVDGWLVFGHDVSSAVDELVMRPDLLLLVAALTLAGGLFHEFGHATASRYGGAEPGVIGVGVYLVWPVFYNDLNDSYRLTRHARLRADLGGVYFNAVFILMLAAAYAATGAPPLLVAIAVQHFAVAQQFLPFVRLDGYYVVSDLAGVPDLFSRIRPMIRGLARGHGPTAVLADLTPRARAIVTAWVVTTIPVLVGLTVLLLSSLPRLLGGAWDAIGVHGGTAVAAAGDGDVGVAVLGVLRVVFLTVPLVGLGGVLVSVLLATGRRYRRGRSTRMTAPAPLTATRPVARVRPVALIAFLVVAVAWVAGRARRRMTLR